MGGEGGGVEEGRGGEQEGGRGEAWSKGATLSGTALCHHCASVRERGTSGASDEEDGGRKGRGLSQH